MKKQLSEMSLAELQEHKQKSKKMWTFLGGLMIGVCIVLIFVAIQTKNYALIAVAMGSMTTLMAGVAALKTIDAEIEKRQAQ
jgi:hypothetical protein